MGETHRSRAHLSVAAAAGYGVVFACLCVLHVPAIAIAAYFVIPTALVAIAGGPAAGVGGALLSMILVAGSWRVNPGTLDTTAPSLSSSGRIVALLLTGVLLGWFAQRNRVLLARLRAGAERDHLTGLGNYRLYEAAVERRLRAGEPFALVLCDMDGLKDVNDGHGHSAGDEALRTLADGLRALTRPGDEIARIGGDEFCVVAAVQDEEGAAALGLRFERHLAAEGCRATFGWASAPGGACTKDELFKLADECLYARKASPARRLQAV